MEKKKKLKKLIIILVIIIAAILVVIFAAKKMVSGLNDTISMRIQMQQVEKNDLSDTITLTGTVSGETMHNYTSNVQSKFVTVDVEVGDEVKKGDVIATLDQETIKKDIAALEKAISNSNALVQNQSDMNKKALADAKEEQKEALADAEEVIEKSKKAITQAEKELAEAKSVLDDLVKDGALQEDIENAQTAVDFAEDNLVVCKDAYEEANDAYKSIKKSTDDVIASAQNTIDMEKYMTDSNEDAYTQLEELKKQLTECTILCEEDGIVTSVNVYEGAYNTPGSAIVTVETNEAMILTASVEETDILKLQEGMQAVVTAKALGDKELKGEVIKVIKIANASGGGAGMGGDYYSPSTVAGYSVQIRIEPSELISGMSAKAKVFLSQKTNVLCVPYDVVQEDEVGKFVLVGEDNGDGTYTAVRKSIEIGEEVNYYTEVTGGEIAEGDLVILDLFIAEGEVFEGDYFMDAMEEEVMLY